MALVLGLLLGVGLVLVLAPWWWPRTAARGVRRRSRLDERLAQAGFDRVPGLVLVLLSVLLGMVAGALVFALTGILMATSVAAIAAALVPWFAVTASARRRRRARATLWPDLVDHLVAAIRSGASLPDAVASLAESAPAAFAAPFARFADDWSRRGDWTGAVDDLKRALADPVGDRVLETLRMARQVGGTELTAVLRTLGEHLRRDQAIRAELEARQSWLMNAARLGVAAPWLVLAILSTRPEAASAYNSAAGGVLIVVAVAASVIAYRLMIRIGRLPEPPRVFGAAP